MKFRFIGGVALLGVAAAVLVVYPKWFLPPPTETITGYIGGSKANFLDDQAVKDILAERYQLEVQYSTLGGRELVSAIKDAYDFLWPGTDLAVEDYKASHGGKAKYELLLLSPIVMYTWQPVTKRLTEVGLIDLRADGTYYANMSRFVPALLEERIPLPEGQTGGNPVAVFTSDPTQSNSGQVFAALLAQTLQDLKGGSFEQAFPQVKAYIDNLGFKPPRTSDLFKQCIGKGMGACPIFVAYESSASRFCGRKSYQLCRAPAPQSNLPRTDNLGDLSIDRRHLGRGEVDGCPPRPGNSEDRRGNTRVSEHTWQGATTYLHPIGRVRERHAPANKTGNGPTNGIPVAATVSEGACNEHGQSFDRHGAGSGR